MEHGRFASDVVRQKFCTTADAGLLAHRGVHHGLRFDIRRQAYTGAVKDGVSCQPHFAWPPTAVMVMWPIVVVALAPCQWRSPALMWTTSPTLISCGVPPSTATMPEPEVTTRIWSQVWVCQPVVQPWLKLTTLQL